MTSSKDTVLITGGCGYIGSHIVYNLLDNGYGVVVVDDLSNSRRDLLPPEAIFYQASILDTDTLQTVLKKHNVAAVIHMAAFLSVEESMKKPLAYYNNNVEGTRSLLDACLNAGVKKVLFSSTGATYASSEKPLRETDAQNPSSPYGRSKLMAEQLVRDVTSVSDIKAVILRYFNVAGADPKGRTGQQGTNATHLIARACQTAAGDRPNLSILGTDYPTKDGTCVRDYIHVSDLAEAHRVTLEQDFAEPVKVFNCGYNKGYSVKEIAEQTQKVTGIAFPVITGARRPGDLAQTVADNTALLTETSWRPENDNIDVIIDTAWKWYQRERIARADTK